MTGSVWLGLVSVAVADPCGMVPPIWTGNGPEPVGIERTGLQNTYVFFREGVETIAIRPGFTGSVEQFGMLVPLPSEPSLRKIDERTFTHLEASIDPPTVVAHVYEDHPYERDMPSAPEAGMADATGDSLQIARDEVRVVKEEAIGMYEVAVLEAGSSAALERWMTQNAFRYPTGMDDAVEDFVRMRWMFVAVKARVAAMAGVDAQPGMRSVDPKLPSGSRFDGYVQGMAFRFRTPEPVMPMRLSVFNGNDTHNRVYVVTEGPVRIADVPTDLVRRQVGTEKLYTNLTGPLPVRIDGPRERIGADGWATIEQHRDPAPYVGIARDLLTSDLLAVSRGELALPFEERENELLRVNEALGLRGAAVDHLLAAELAAARDAALASELQRLARMTLTVVDGDFPREVLRDQVLTLAPFAVPTARNRPEAWTVAQAGPQLWIPFSTSTWERWVPW